MSLCERCRAHPAEMTMGEICLCTPCAEQLSWSHGVQASPQPAAIPPPGTPRHVVADYLVGAQLAQKLAEPPRSDGFPWLRVMAALGGVAVVGVAGLWIYKITETAGETRRSAMRVIETHPEVLRML